MHIAILGRQPALGVAELEQIYGSDAVSWFGEASARIEGDTFDFHQLGGSLKAGRVTLDIPGGNWRKISAAIIEHYVQAWQETEHKITLGISAYGWNVSAREVQGTGIIIKKQLRSHDVSVRLVPNQEEALSTATSHHNKLGANPHRIELLVVRAGSGRVIIAESVGSQNISALAARDQARPRTDAFVGMLPPKLARIMVNLTALNGHSRVSTASSFDEGSALPAERGKTNNQLASSAPETKDTRRTDDAIAAPTILDPFCGTGVVLQEAWIDGFNVYGTDLSEKMVEYSHVNLKWLREQYERTGSVTIGLGDAMTFKWKPPIDAVVCETYLGQPFSAPPSPAKLTEVRGNCDHIVSDFLTNIAGQIPSGTPLCVAIPAWNDGNDHFTHLPLTERLEELGYRRHELKHVRPEQLLYYREGQVVARELLILEKV
jgi:tRNA G10  N-methylase Trm11